MNVIAACIGHPYSLEGTIEAAPGRQLGEFGPREAGEVDGDQRGEARDDQRQLPLGGGSEEPTLEAPPQGGRGGVGGREAFAQRMTHSYLATLRGGPVSAPGRVGMLVRT